MQLLLNRNELIDLGTHLGETEIVCCKGICWITVEGDDRDHILRAEDRFMTRQKGRVQVVALSSVCLQLVHAQRPESSLNPLCRIGGWQKKRAFYC